MVVLFASLFVWFGLRLQRIRLLYEEVRNDVVTNHIISSLIKQKSNILPPAGPYLLLCDFPKQRPSV